MKPRAILGIGAFFFLASWFLPVIDALTRPPGRFVGWDAFLAALWPYQAGGEPWYQGLHFVASALSNLPLAGSLALVFTLRRSPPRWLRLVVTACALLNTHWVLFTFRDDRGELRIGYYLWALSFFLVAAGLELEARRSASRRPQGPDAAPGGAA